MDYINTTNENASLNVSSVELPKPFWFEFYIALGFLVLVSIIVVIIGSRRALSSFKTVHTNEELLTVSSTLQFPLAASQTLFGLYVLLQYIPSEYISTLLGWYLGGIGVVALNMVVRPVIPASIPMGVSCLIIGGLYMYYKHWIISNILAISIGITGLEQIVCFPNFKIISLLLCFLFFYDIFWVFSTDVMLTVATSIDGPIKILFPQHILTNPTGPCSLLGLGDIVIPGFYIAFMHAFSYLGRKCNNNNNNSTNKSRNAADTQQQQQQQQQQKEVVEVSGDGFYFYLAVIAYICSLINTMAIMVIFKHGQPALLYIVPWLLITTLFAATAKGELSLLLNYEPFSEKEEPKNSKKANNNTTTTTATAATITDGDNKAAKLDGAVEVGMADVMYYVKNFFGLVDDNEKTKNKNKNNNKSNNKKKKDEAKQNNSINNNNNDKQQKQQQKSSEKTETATTTNTTNNTKASTQVQQQQQQQSVKKDNNNNNNKTTSNKDKDNSNNVAAPQQKKVKGGKGKKQ